MATFLSQSKVAATVCTLAIACGCSVNRVAETDASGQLVFDNPSHAVSTLKTAVKSEDKATLARLFGKDGADLINSGDPVADAESLRVFAASLSEQSTIVSVEQLDRPNRGVAVLVTGKLGWPFPIPLIEEGGRWKFDTAEGKEEIINRRIGRNELRAISVCRGYVNAQREYQAAERAYAGKVMSTPGKRDGLYWESGRDEAPSPLGPFVAQASEEGYRQGRAARQSHYHGYQFRILTAQGKSAPGGARNYLDNGRMTKGFALVAYPISWNESGVMTFIVGPEGVIYQKDLGANTREVVSRMTAYDPDPSWRKVG